MSEANREQLAAAVTLQSTLEETRLAAIQIMTGAVLQTRREHSPRVREECDIVLAYLQQLQTAVAKATCPQDIDGGFLYGSDMVCLPDMDDVDNGLLLHKLLTYREGPSRT